MSLRSWLLFLSVVLTLLSIIHGFILIHLWPLVEFGPLRWIMLGIFILLASSYILGRALESVTPRLSQPLLHIGSWWLGIMTYLFLGCLLLDILFIFNCFFPVMPEQTLDWLRLYFLGLGLVILVLLIAGYFNVKFPRVRKLPQPSFGKLRLVVASDIHLCGLVSASRLNRIVDLINAEHPDLILLPGDTIDEDLTRSPRSDVFRRSLQRLTARHGVIAVTGNHEWISGVDAAVDWLESCGITVLRDRAIDLGPVVVVGRDDAASQRMGGSGAEVVALDTILNELNQSTLAEKKLIVLDHQPTRIPEAVACGADLVLCGHTHHGQFWPFQWITKCIFPVSHGHKKFQHTDVYVSCGAGAWGPQIRTSSRSEIILIENF
jgi:hypothetical protein